MATKLDWMLPAMLAVALIGAPGTASATTEADCEAAIAELDERMAENPADQTEADGEQEEIQTKLAQAGEAGLQGRFDECLRLVEEAKGMAGLRY